MGPESQELAIDPRRVLGVLIRIAVVIVITGTAVSLIRVNVGWEVDPSDFGARFELVREQSLPSWFSSLQLAASAPLLCLLAWRSKRAGSADWYRWAGLAVLMTVFSLDEVASFHEYSSVILGIEVFGFHGAYNWVVFGAIFLVVLGVVYAPFVAGLEPVLRLRLVLGAGIYFGGALGVEMLNAHLASNGGEAGYRYALQTTVEESMEIGGAILVFYALLCHVLQPGYRLVVSLAEAADGSRERVES